MLSRKQDVSRGITAGDAEDGILDGLIVISEVGVFVCISMGLDVGALVLGLKVGASSVLSINVGEFVGNSVLVDTGCLVGCCSLLGSTVGGSFVGFLDGDDVITGSSKTAGRLLGLLDDVGGGMSPLVCVCF